MNARTSRAKNEPKSAPQFAAAPTVTPAPSAPTTGVPAVGDSERPVAGHEPRSPNHDTSSAASRLRSSRNRGSALFFNRELSWLDFNARVLEEATNPDVRLLERLKFLAIFCNNLDEFFMIHVPGMLDRINEEGGRSNVDIPPPTTLRAVKQKVEPMLAATLRCYQEIMPQLAAHGIRVLRYAELDETAKSRMEAYFEREVFPVLTPLAVDPGHPFPYISNLSLSLAVIVADPRTGDNRFARVKVPGPPVLPRLVPIPGEKWHFLLMEELITVHIGRLFAGMEVRACHPFRVTRNADLELQEDQAVDLMEMMEEELSKRRFGELTRLELSNDVPDEMRRMIMEELQANEDETYTLDGPLNLADFMPLTSIAIPELRDPPFVPGVPAALRPPADMYAAIRAGDILLHHPYQTFNVVTDFLRRAATDPQVLAIKHTLYRTSGDSPVLQALIDAAEQGKQVVCLVELKARFDEANNINWAKQLEKAGVHVVYGLVGLKTHCKLTLAVRREEDGLRRYLHVGTGNYNPKTANTYTDVGLFTCNPDFGDDATDLFNFLTGYARQEHFRKFLVAPVTLRSELQRLIEREAERHTPESPGRIIAKMNALVDPALIKSLYAASQQGVQIDLIIRGMCCLRPGVPGLSENIRVVSIIGRFLEHSRIFYFQNSGMEEIYFGSADWMPRNLDRRIEVVVPVENAEIRRVLHDDILRVLLEDNCQAWDLQSDGTYLRRRPSPTQTCNSSQLRLLQSLSG